MWLEDTEGEARFFLEVGQEGTSISGYMGNSSYFRKEDFYCESGQVLVEVTQRSCNFFSPGNIQEPTGHTTKQLDLMISVLRRGVD